MAYEAATLAGPQMFAADGSLITREGYDDILYSEEMRQFFRDNIYGKEGYEKEPDKNKNLHIAAGDTAFVESRSDDFWVVILATFGHPARSIRPEKSSHSARRIARIGRGRHLININSYTIEATYV